jgi:hypothetical protein
MVLCQKASTDAYNLLCCPSKRAKGLTAHQRAMTTFALFLTQEIGVLKVKEYCEVQLTLINLIIKTKDDQLTPWRPMNKYSFSQQIPALANSAIAFNVSLTIRNMSYHGQFLMNHVMDGSPHTVTWTDLHTL